MNFEENQADVLLGVLGRPNEESVSKEPGSRHCGAPKEVKWHLLNTSKSNFGGEKGGNRCEVEEGFGQEFTQWISRLAETTDRAAQNDARLTD